MSCNHDNVIILLSLKSRHHCAVILFKRYDVKINLHLIPLLIGGNQAILLFHISSHCRIAYSQNANRLCQFSFPLRLRLRLLRQIDDRLVIDNPDD
ncbi:hypothetical protein D3C77_318810 [compost metagenome]